MINNKSDEFLWVEKYRPQTVADCILPQRIKKIFQEVVDNGELQHFLLYGAPGTGKTSLARALCNEMGLDYILINASENGNIDTLRTTIRNYASTMSFNSKYKVIILDEADFLNCLEENEVVRLTDGSEIKLKDMVDSVSYDVFSVDMETGEIEKDTAQVINRTEKEVYEVEFENGAIINVTDDHPFIVEDEDGNLSTRTIKEGFDDVKIVFK